MIRHFILLGLMVLWYGTLQAQLWESVGGGTNRWIRAMYPDTSTGLLYVAGGFDSAGGVSRYQVASWDGQNWGSLGAGTGDTNCMYGCEPIISIWKQDDNVFVGGHHTIMGGIYGNGKLSRWDGSRWDTCGSPDVFVSVESSNGKLFAMGEFDSLSQQPAWKVAQWNGTFWESFVDSVPISEDWGVNCVAHYQDKYFFGGNFTSATCHEILAWDGQEWSTLDGGILGLAWVNRLCVYRDLLFVGGYFSSNSGNAASHIMAWDGTRWLDPFPGIDYEGQVFDLQVIDGLLYIVGTHRINDGGNWHGYYELAKYDGINFCSFGGVNYQARNIAGLNGDIYISTDYIVHGDTIGFLGKWIGGDSVDYCVSQPVRVQDPIDEALSISVIPNPTQSKFTISLPPDIPSVRLRVLDLAGREVIAYRSYGAGSPPVAVEHLPAGLYFVEVLLKGRKEVIKLVKE